MNYSYYCASNMHTQLFQATFQKYDIYLYGGNYKDNGVYLEIMSSIYSKIFWRKAF